MVVDYVTANKDRIFKTTRAFVKTAVQFSEAIRDLPFGPLVGDAARFLVDVEGHMQNAAKFLPLIASLPDKLSSVDG